MFTTLLFGLTAISVWKHTPNKALLQFQVVLYIKVVKSQVSENVMSLNVVSKCQLCNIQMYLFAGKSSDPEIISVLRLDKVQNK